MVQKIRPPIWTDAHLPPGRQRPQRGDRGLVDTLNVGRLGDLVALYLVGIGPRRPLRVVINVIVLPIGGDPPLPPGGKVALLGEGVGALVKHAPLLLNLFPSHAPLHFDGRHGHRWPLPGGSPTVVVHVKGASKLIDLPGPASRQRPQLVICHLLLCRLDLALHHPLQIHHGRRACGRDGRASAGLANVQSFGGPEHGASRRGGGAQRRHPGIRGQICGQR